MAIAILAVGLLVLLGMLSSGSVNVYAAAGQSKATAYARQQVEQLRSQPFNPGPANGADSPDDASEVTAH